MVTFGYCGVTVFGGVKTTTMTQAVSVASAPEVKSSSVFAVGTEVEYLSRKSGRALRGKLQGYKTENGTLPLHIHPHPPHARATHGSRTGILLASVVEGAAVATVPGRAAAGSARAECARGARRRGLR